MGKSPRRMQRSRPNRSRRRRLLLESLEQRLVLDTGVAGLVDDLFEVNQNSPQQVLDVLANDVFPEGYGGQQRITSVSFGSEGGRVEIADNAGAVRYVPPADFFGTERFVYYVDNQLSATVTVAVSSPLAPDEYQFPPDGQAKVLDVAANDPFWPGYEGPREITLIGQTSLGSEVAIAADGKSLIYTPSHDARGKDAFVYIVDGLYSAEVKIEILDPLTSDSYPGLVQKSENNLLKVLDNDPFWSGYLGARQITFVTEPNSGATVTIAADGKTLSYTPPAEFQGWDHFTYVVDAAYEANVSLQVHRPVREDRFEIDTNTTDHPLNLTGNDYFYYWEGGSKIKRDVIDRVTSVGETAEGGTVTIMAHGQGVLYSAPAGFEGTDTFEYVADGKHEATVTVDVTLPVRDDFINSVYLDTVDHVLDVLKNDFIGNGYTGSRVITSVSETSEGGVVTIGPGGRSLVYTPLPDFLGTDEFSYTVDGELQGEVRVLVSSIIGEDNFQFYPDPSRTEYLLDVLADDHFGPHYPGPGLITAVGQTANGGSVTISANGKYLLFVPTEGGADQFTYTVDDKYEASVGVSFKNYLVSDSIVVDQNSSDNESTPLDNDFRPSAHRPYYRGPRQITSAGPSQQGAAVSIAADGKTLLYSPPADFTGSDRFTYTVDGLMQTTVSVQVVRRVRDDLFRVEPESSQNVLPVLINDLFGADYVGAGRITAVTETSQGGTATVGEDGKSISYTPPAGFSGEDEFTYTVDGVLKAEVTVAVSASVEDVLSRFDSVADFEQFLLDDALQRYEHLFGQEYRPPWRWWVDEIGPDAVSATADSSRSHSETNVQVAGVDEGDIIETDGDYLYILRGQELIIAAAWPAEEMAIASRLAIEGLPIAEYLHGNRLTVISQAVDPLPVEEDVIDWFPPPPRQMKTLVTVYDVSDRDSPAVVQKTELDGRYVDSRRIDDFVFLVQRDDRGGIWLPPPELVDEPATGDAQQDPFAGFQTVDGLWVPPVDVPPEIGGVYESRQQYLERMKEEIGGIIDSILPHYTSYGPDGEIVQTGLINAPEDLFQPPSDDARNLISVVSLNVSSDKAGIGQSTGILTTGADKIYGSLQSLYVFESQSTPEDRSVTEILKFDWDARTGSVEFAARGHVAGRMLNQFSADESEGYLRIATTVSNSYSGNWSGRSENVLFVLRDDAGVLEFVGGIQNLALEESIRSVRFMGQRAFVTTFRNIDPLFALDLSDPAHPQSRGHVTMPGFNSYMQLIDANHILAVGRNTPLGGSGPTQVSLFDVSDLGRPELIDQYTFERFSTSEAEADHHAFGWFAEHEVLAMPSARSHFERVDEDGDGYHETRKLFREDELFVFKIDVTATRQSGGGIQLLGETEHESPVRRSAFIEDVLYSIGDDSVHAVGILDPTLEFARIDLRPVASVERDGTTLIVQGTNHEDHFEFDASAGELLTVNGVEYPFDAAEVETISLDGAAGNDTLTITGSDNDETFAWAGGKVSFLGNGFQLRAAGIENVTVTGGGGFDVASLEDSDGDDRFAARPDSALLEGPGYWVQVDSYDAVHAYARNEGTDRATFVDSPGKDKFKADGNYGKMRNAKYINRAKFFEIIQADFSEGGTEDNARLWDSPKQDTFVGQPGDCRFYSDETSFDVTVRGADFLTVFSTNGGNDKLILHDSPDDDIFLAKSHKIELLDRDTKGDVYKITARKFKDVTAYADQGGRDIAKLYDSTPEDLWEAEYVDGQTWSRMTSETRQLYTVLAFEQVKGYSVNGGTNRLQKDRTVDFLIEYGDWERWTQS